MHQSASTPLLISTDFDGTLVCDYDSALAPEFFERLLQLRKTRRVVWVINTGRDWTSLAEILEQKQVPCWPDWVVLVEREIHRVNNRQTVPLPAWNEACAEAHQTLFRKAQPAFASLRQSLGRFPNLKMIVDIGSPLGLIADSEAQADSVEELLEPLFAEVPEIKAVRNSIYIRFAHADFHKGSCLDAIAQAEKIGPDACFAVGDHFNDLPMLQPSYAAHIACPSNAVEQVKAQVRRHGGFVAGREGHHGVVEALDHFFPGSK